MLTAGWTQPATPKLKLMRMPAQLSEGQGHSLKAQPGQLQLPSVIVQAGLIIRSAYRGYLPEKSFVIVSLLATAVLLFAWRGSFAALSSKV